MKLHQNLKHFQTTTAKRVSINLTKTANKFWNSRNQESCKPQIHVINNPWVTKIKRNKQLFLIKSRNQPSVSHWLLSFSLIHKRKNIPYMNEVKSVACVWQKAYSLDSYTWSNIEKVFFRSRLIAENGIGYDKCALKGSSSSFFMTWFECLSKTFMECLCQ